MGGNHMSISTENGLKRLEVWGIGRAQDSPFREVVIDVFEIPEP